jgi:hypothetical protein
MRGVRTRQSRLPPSGTPIGDDSPFPPGAGPSARESTDDDGQAALACPQQQSRSVPVVRDSLGRFAPKARLRRSVFPLLAETEPFFLRECAEDAEQLRSYARLDNPRGNAPSFGVPADAAPETRYGNLLDHLGGLAAGGGHAQSVPSTNDASAAGPSAPRLRGRDVFLSPPALAVGGGADHHGEADSLPFTLDHRGRHETCITLDPARRESKGRRRRRKRIVWHDGGGYYKVEVYSYSVVVAAEEGRGGKRRRVAGLELAHRLVLWSIFGPPPPGSNCPIAVHMCGNRGCVNPEHLVWGTYAINAITNPAEARKAFLDLLRAQGRRPPQPPAPSL